MKLTSKTNYDKFLDIITLMYICAVYALPYQVLYMEMIFIIFHLPKIKKIKINAYLIWSFSFLLVCFLSVIYSVNMNETFIKSFQILKIFIVGNIFILKLKEEKDLEKIYNYFILAGLFFIVVLLILFPISSFGKERIGGGAYNANDIGLKLCISLIINLYFIFIKKYRNILYIIPIPIFYTFVLFTGSRKAFVFAVLPLLLYFILNSNKKIKLIITLPIILILSYFAFEFLMTVPIFYNILGKRIETFLNMLNGSGKVDGSSLERYHMIKIGQRLWDDKPWFGYGMGGYSVLSGFNTYSHNNYIEVLVSNGLFGFFAYYSFYIYLLIKFIKEYFNKNKIIYPLMISFLILIPSEMAMITYYDRFWGLILVLCYISINIYRNRSNNN